MRYLLLVFLPFALPELAKAAPIMGQQCVKNSFDKTWSDLRHEVAIMKDDQRWGIEAGGPHYGLTPDEVTYLRKVTGEVRCPEKKSGKEWVGTGFLLGRSDQIVTNAHAFYKRSRQFDLSKCYFTSRAIPPVRRRIELSDGTALFGTKDADADFANDYAIARLDQPIAGVDPLPVATAGLLKEKDQVFIISAQMARMRRPVSAGEPIIQRCAIIDSIPADESSGSTHYGDCSGSGGVSGSPALIRAADGTLQVVGVVHGSGKEEQDNMPYDWKTKNYMVILGADGKFGASLNAMTRR